MNPIVEQVTNDQLKQNITQFKVGDTIQVTVRIREGEKERSQKLSGIVINRKGRGIQSSFTISRASAGSRTLHVFPLHAPTIISIVVEKESKVTRARLNHLAKRVSKDSLKKLAKNR